MLNSLNWTLARSMVKSRRTYAIRTLQAQRNVNTNWLFPRHSYHTLKYLNLCFSTARPLRTDKCNKNNTKIWCQPSLRARFIPPPGTPWLLDSAPKHSSPLASLFPQGGAQTSSQKRKFCLPKIYMWIGSWPSQWPVMLTQDHLIPNRIARSLDIQKH